MTSLKTNIILDLSNLLWITKFSSLKGGIPFSKELIIHDFLSSINNLHIKYRADGILVACDSRNLWRTDIYPQYKANRIKTRDANYEDMKLLMNEIKDFFNECTAIPAISVDKTEADDIIAIASKLSTQRNVIISSDKDFIQLINDKTHLYSPTLKGERKTEDKDYELFEKCIRGDSGDNVFSAYPRVRTKVLQEVWGDPIALANLFETKRKLDGRKVGDVYMFNKQLIDLDMIPANLQSEIKTEIASVGSEQRHLDQIAMLQFFGKHELKKLAKNQSGFSKFFQKGFIL